MSWKDRVHLCVLSASLYLRIQGRSTVERTAILVHHGLCPHCREGFVFGDKGLLIDGPRGGAAQNVYCPDCQHGWNYTPGSPPGMLPVEALGKIDPALIRMYQSRMVWTDDRNPLDHF